MHTPLLTRLRELSPCQSLKFSVGRLQGYGLEKAIANDLKQEMSTNIDRTVRIKMFPHI